MTAPAAPLRLNHAELAVRPGEGPLARALFEALGCGTYEIEAEGYGRYIIVRLDDAGFGTNDIFIAEAEPEQLALEEALGQAMADPGLADAAADFAAFQRERPYRATHFGLRLANVRALDEAVARLEALAAGELAGRLHIGPPTVRTKEEALASDTPVKQLWIGTDVASTGILAFGQQIELQAYDA